MKKKVISMLLATTMVASLLAGCGEAAAPAADAAAPAAQEETEEAAEEVADEGAEAQDAGEGSVYMLNFKPETDDVWQELAATYTEQTGVDVTVLTAADGTYDTTLTSEMAKTEAPTIFNVGNSAAAQTWNDYTYDLSATSLYDALTDKSLVLEYDGKVAAVANCYECYGIIYNKTILADYCAMDGAVVKSIDEINNFDTFKAVCEDINSRVDEINDALGTNLTEAFASSGLDDSSSWRFSGHLAGLALYYEFKDAGCDLIGGQSPIEGKYLDQFKNVWDNYVATSAENPKTLTSGATNAEQELGMGEAVFYQNGDWEYSAFANPDNGYDVTGDDIAMMPIYFGVDDEHEGLAVGTENFWAINSQAGDANVQASIDFLDWVISSDEGRDAITNKMGLSAPFNTFTGEFASTNKLAACANEYAAKGCTSVAWSFNATPNVDDWRAGVVAGLVEYTCNGGSWDSVTSAFVDGWAEQWALAHEE